ncbi:hypothetical protein FOZ60_001831 [Perkinsus olseni]|uniref:Uncharacterized protein n=1 Tax=Perkinsus olseni TaxID=32597 RepID=A0A7J6PJM6_PEROL|nr:hypothetical protein FOZ60_001831 [Perkinsus olseni]
MTDGHPENNYLAIGTKLATDSGRLIDLIYFSYNSGKYEVLVGPVDEEGHYKSYSGEEEALHRQLGDVNPFYHLLKDIEKNFKIRECQEIAEYIEGHPADEYEEGKDWLHKFMMEKRSRRQNELLM